MTRRATILMLTLASLLLAPAAFAQPKKAEDKQALLRERLEKLRGRVLRQEVGLDEAKAKRVEQVLDKIEPQRRKLRREMATQRRALRNLLDANSADQQAYARAIGNFRAAEKKLQALRDQEFAELSKFLTPKEQAKLFVELRQAQRKLQRTVRQQRQRSR